MESNHRPLDRQAGALTIRPPLPTDMYMKDGLRLSGKGAAVFADELSAAVDSGMGTMTNIFGSKHCLN